MTHAWSSRAGRSSPIDPAASPVDYDLRGRTLMPGWIDTHVHINWHLDANHKSVSGGDTPDRRRALDGRRCVDDAGGRLHDGAERRRGDRRRGARSHQPRTAARTAHSHLAAADSGSQRRSGGAARARAPDQGGRRRRHQAVCDDRPRRRRQPEHDERADSSNLRRSQSRRPARRSSTPSATRVRGRRSKPAARASSTARS